LGDFLESVPSSDFFDFYSVEDFLMSESIFSYSKSS